LLSIVPAYDMNIWEETARHELVTPAWAEWANHRAQQLKERLEHDQN